MAHVGKFFELLTRRDICLNCTNYRVAFPDRFGITGSVIVNRPPVHTYLWPRTVAVRVTDEWDPQPVWETDEVTIDDRTFGYRLSFQDYDIPAGQTRVRANIIAGGDVVLTFTQMLNVPGFCSAWGLSTGLWPVESFDALYWDALGVAASFSATGWNWTEDS